MDHPTLATLRDKHPAWRLLASPHAPLVAAFLHRVETFLQVVVRGSQGRVFVFNYIEGALGYIAVFEGFVTRLFELTYCLEFFFPASFSA